MKRWLRRLLGYRECPLCREVALRWEKVPVLFEDEPPLFGEWRCSACGAATEPAPTWLMDKAARDLGYRDFADWHRARRHD